MLLKSAKDVIGALKSTEVVIVALKSAKDVIGA